ncbi:MAG: hypothetical protein C0502_05480 [Opitutus sp.]|nr:hypothetical protein [Opitutus sp.]
MKLVRPLLLALGIPCALAALALAVALTPAVQRWAVRRALTQRPDWKVGFDSLSAGLGRARLDGAKFERQGVKVTVEHAEADYSLLDYLLHRHVRIDRLVARGVAVDLARLPAGRTQAEAAGAPIAAPGALARLRLPWTLQLGEVRIAGKLTLPPAAGRSAPVADFEISGGGIGPAREGSLLLKASVADAASAAARVTGLRVDGRLTVRETAARAFDRASLLLVLDAEGPQFSDGHQLRLAADMLTVDGVENLTLQLDTQQAGRTARVARLSGALPVGGTRGTGEWDLHAATAQVEPFFLGGALPEFDAAGSGRFTLDVATRALALQGRFGGSLAAPEAIDPALRALGTLHIDTEFDLELERDLARVNRLRLQIDGEQPALAFETTRPLTFNRSERHLQLAAPGAGPLARLSLPHLPLAWVRPFVRAADISGGALSGECSFEEENGQLRWRTTAPLSVDAITVVKAGRLLLERAALSTNLQGSLGAERLTVVLGDLRFRTPAGDSADGMVRLVFPAQGDTQEIYATLNADLPRALDAFAPVGPLRATGSFDVILSPGRVAWRSAFGELSAGNRRKLVSAAMQQSGSLDLATLKLGVEGPVANLKVHTLDLGSLPLLRALVPIAGELAACEFKATAENGRVTVKPVAPLRLSGLALMGLPPGARLSPVGLTLAPTLEFAGRKDWKFTTGEMVFTGRDQATLLTMAVETKVDAANGLRAAATFNADLAALAAQRPFPAVSDLATGRASGEIRAAYAADTLQIEGRSTLNNLVLRESSPALPVANLSFRLARTADKRMTFEAPLLLDRVGQRSDLKLTVAAVRRAEDVLFDAKLGGEHLELGDALALLALGGAQAGGRGNKPAPTAAPRAAAPDAQPFWRGLRGEVSLDVKSISRGADWTMTGLNGRVVVDPQRMALPQLQGLVNEKSRLGARAELRFSEGETPYHLSGNFSLTDFDAGAFLKALDPSKPPVLEGVVTVAGGFTGDGANLDRTLDRTRGQFQLTGRQGVSRLLKPVSEKVSYATKAVDAAAALGSLLGLDKVKGMAEKVAPSAYLADQLSQTLAELPYDQLVVRAHRDDALDLRIDEFSLLSPEVRLVGQGSVTHVEGKTLFEQPLSISCQLAARGKIEQLLGKLHALDGTKDELGYARAKDPGAISGTLARPQTFLFQELLKRTQSKLIDFLN